MAQLLKRLNPEISKYRDRRFDGNQEQFEECLCSSTTLYIGNLSFFTTEEQIWEVFSKVGDVKRIVMGLDKHRRTPCGFCFVVYYTRADAEAAVRYVNGSVLDDRPIRVDFDWGFQEGRQYGRGRSGGQVRDEYRLDYDEGRGGYGKVVLRELSARQAAVQRQMYAEGQDGHGEGVIPGSSYRASKRQRTGGPLEEESEGGGDGSGRGPSAEEQQRGARYRDRDSDEED